MFHYAAYGLNIESEIPLSGLAEGLCGADVEVCRGQVRFPPEASNQKTWLTATDAYLRFEGVGAIRASHGKEIVVDAAAGVEDAIIGLFVLGPALGILLHQRNLLVLHASAVAVNGGAVAFLGMSGSGKSTTAGALGRLGYTLFADDIVPVSLGHQRPMALPGFPRLKLGVDVAETLGYPGSSLPPLMAGDERREIHVRGVPPEMPRPLERIYVLAKGEPIAIEPLRPPEAAFELIRHSYAALCFKASGSSGTHLRYCAAVVNRLPVYRLRRPIRLELIHEVARLVEMDLGVETLARLQGVEPAGRLLSY